MRLLATALTKLTVLMAASVADAARRVALVIGNGNYQGPAALANPARDAAAIAEVLKPLSF